MNLIVKILNLMILTCALIAASEQITIPEPEQEIKSCPDNPNRDEECGAYCYGIVKHLLQYVASIRGKEEEFAGLRTRLLELELSVQHLEATIAAGREQIKLLNELNEVYKTNAAVSEELIREKNKRLAELETKSEQFELNSNVESTEFKAEQMETEKSEKLTLPKAAENASLTQKKVDNYIVSNCLGRSTDIYMLKMPGVEPFPVACDSSLSGAGWTVVQRRRDGSENFNRNWADYREGFGDLRGEFFMGLEKLHALTAAQAHELYIHLEDFDNQVRYSHYTHFLIGSEKDAYALKSLGKYSGTADNALSRHENWQFSTPDRPVKGEVNCAEKFRSGWWFNSGCYHCNLNGPYVAGSRENSNAIEWRTWHFKPLKFVQMMIRPKSAVKEKEKTYVQLIYIDDNQINV